MAMLILERDVEAALRAERRARGIDKYDEVWNGVYVMSPLADDEHQDLVGGLCAILRAVIQLTGLGAVRPGVNVSDREAWKKNFRIPDVAVFLQGTKAENRGLFWLGGPDFAIEITSKGDRTRKKLSFYASVGVRELLVVHRRPWKLSLFRFHDGQLRCVGTSTIEQSDPLRSEIVPLTFRLFPGETRPQIEVRQSAEVSWLV
jgi:Uma2 family endonuclease